jgi:hypothetical protein
MPAIHDEGEVAALETKYCVRIPEEFREYLLKCCPNQNFGLDDSMTAWWSVGRIRNIPDEYNHAIAHPFIQAHADTFLFFADFLIWAPAWAIACGDDENRGRVAAIGGGEDRFVADSFGEFVDRFIGDVSTLI